ncbi:MAG: hypothetical protein GF353_06280 [Candidatus Lokiarchaeota archaeon]|nr:hypothetical protein [Candidatus Lokiarchaeota archaeon]
MVAVNSLEYNTLLILTIILLAIKLTLIIFLSWKIVDRTKKEGKLSFDFIVSVLILFLSLFLSRILYSYFDFVLTQFDPDKFYLVPNIYVWKIANFISQFGICVVLFYIDRKVLEFRFKGIFSYLLFFAGIAQFFYPINTFTDFQVASAIGALALFVVLILPVLFIYIGIKSEKHRLVMIIITIGTILYMVGANLQSEFILAPLKIIFGENIQITFYILSLVFKLTGLSCISYGSTKFYM